MDVNSENFDPMELVPRTQEMLNRSQHGAANNASSADDSNPASTANDNHLETMVRAAGRLEIDESGHMDFHGHSSGVTYLNHLNSEFGSLIGDAKASIPPRAEKVDSPMSVHSPGENLPDTSLLPPKDVALTLVDTCLNSACVLMRFIHRPSFIAVMNSIYDNNAENYNEEENRFLPLLYEALAVGCLFMENIQQFGIDDGLTQAYGPTTGLSFV